MPYRTFNLNEAAIYLHVLARLCMISKQTKVLLQLREAKSANAIVTILRRAEENMVGQM